jgi:hypothetical protein
MSTSITVKCPTCHHSFRVDLTDYQPIKILYRDSNQSDTIKEYRFECANDKKHIFIVPITFMEKTSD